jgi:hypothetical protein
MMPPQKLMTNARSKWTTTDELLDAGVSIHTIAWWCGCSPSEAMGREFPSYTVTSLLDHTDEWQII